MSNYTLKDLKRGNTEAAYTKVTIIEPIGEEIYLHYHGKKDLFNALYNQYVVNRNKKKMDGCIIQLRLEQGEKVVYLMGKLREYA